MSGQRLKRIAAFALTICISLAIACHGEESAASYTTWHWKETYRNMVIDADVSGYRTDARISILRCVKQAWTAEQEERMANAIFPRLATAFPLEDLHLLLVKDGKALGADFDREAFYGTCDWEHFGDGTNIVFSDSCICAITEQAAPYETVTYVSTDAQGYEWLDVPFGDLRFASRAEVIGQSGSLMRDLGISAEEQPFFIMAYSDDPEAISEGQALAYRQFMMNGHDAMEPYRNKVSELGGECYQLNYSVLYNGIPTSLYTKYLAMEDTFNDPPTVQIWWNRSGMLYLRAWNLLTVNTVMEPSPIVSVAEAAGIADDYAGNLLTFSPLTCIRVRLEYYTANYRGGVDGRDYDLVPMWTFYFSGGSEPITVNAITGELVW